MRGARCQCFICKKGRETINSKENKTHLVPSFMQVNKELEINLERDHQKVRSICMFCFKETGKGLRHPCNKTQRKKNLSNLLQAASPKTKGVIIS